MKNKQNDSNIVLFGTGRLSEMISDYLNVESNFTICGYTIENQYKNDRNSFLEKPLVDFEELEKTFPPSRHSLFNAVGNNYTRERIYTESKLKGYSFISHISPKALQKIRIRY